LTEVISGRTLERMSVSVGGPAVPFALPDATGELRRLDDWRGRWLLLVFHRHLA
jgi:peroxiredoxin